jgi:hypothetical protein
MNQLCGCEKRCRLWQIILSRKEGMEDRVKVWKAKERPQKFLLLLPLLVQWAKENFSQKPGKRKKSQGQEIFFFPHCVLMTHATWSSKLPLGSDPGIPESTTRLQESLS